MADVNITVTVPDAHVASMKAAIEHYLKGRGELESGGSLTNPQASTALKKLLSDRLMEILRVWKQDTKKATAMQEAETEISAISIV